MNAFMQMISNLWNRIFKPSQPATPVNPPVTPNPTSPEATMSRKALSVMINNYPGTNSDLSGCINDGNDWINTLVAKHKFESAVKLVDSQATRAAVKNALSKLVNEAKSGDVLVFTYSGHGSYVADKSGDETDGKDETLYVYDGNILDDELKTILSGLKDGVSMTIILDSCHSGTATRFTFPNAPKARFMPPSDPETLALADKLPVRKKLFVEEDMKEILMSGCQSTEYSYDASFNGRPNGAFTRAAIDSLSQLGGNPTYEEWYAAIRKKLPSNDYPQTPQFEGPAAKKRTKVFS